MNRLALSPGLRRAVKMGLIKMESSHTKAMRLAVSSGVYAPA